MARIKFHSLKHPRIRASWNKFNLYNLSRLKIPNTTNLTLFQQKWAAKKITRAYHGEFIREKQWNRLFSPNLRAVVPMDPIYLAEHDGSELASGRGAGLETKAIDTREEFKQLVEKNGDQMAWGKQLGRMPMRSETPWKEQMHAYFDFKEKEKKIPYLHQTFAPMERRVDVAIWRALFASSARQARQMVVHGKVKVNGQKMPYPGYLLNPGDMFQVDADAVQYATSDTKTTLENRATRKVRKSIRNRNRSLLADKIAHGEAVRAKKAKFAMEGKEWPMTIRPRFHEDEPFQREVYEHHLSKLIKRCELKLAVRRPWALNISRRQRLRAFLQNARKLFREFKHQDWPHTEERLYDLAAEWKVTRQWRSLRLRKAAWFAMKGIRPNSRQGKTMKPLPADLFSLEQKKQLLRKLCTFEQGIPPKLGAHEGNVSEALRLASRKRKTLLKKRRVWRKRREALEGQGELSEEQEQFIAERRRVLEEERDVLDVQRRGLRNRKWDLKVRKEMLRLENRNRHRNTKTKPYPYPFRPKPFMSAFAFIPRYLEVHHKICSAVYLRHPVARPGKSEVPSPFPTETMQLAHQWYLRRR